jgi:ABC-type transporter Mla subunit MlaD
MVSAGIRHITSGSVCLAFVLVVSAGAGPRELLEKEAQELKSKIADTKAKINDTRGQMKRDVDQFGGYKGQAEKYNARVKSERDSLKHDYKSLQREMDQLSGNINATQSRQKELEQTRVSAGQVLLDACDRLKKIIATLPPGSARAQAAPLEFLRSEISAKSVENNEALERILQIYHTLDDIAQSIEVFQGPSTFDQIPGQVDFIQIGLAYLALVSDNGSAGALWVPTEDSTGGAWQKIDNATYLANLRKAVKIRGGNAVPEIVDLPFQHIVRQEVGE